MENGIPVAIPGSISTGPSFLDFVDRDAARFGVFPLAPSATLKATVDLDKVSAGLAQRR